MYLDITNKTFRKALINIQHAVVSPRGKSIEIAYHAQMTKFEISDFVKQSKKTRFIRLILK